MDLERMLADLRGPEAYVHRPARVELITTHISWVFLAGDLVFKIKKPVDFGFLDFTTLDRRLFYCREEVRLNRRLCPEIYLGVENVTLTPDGRHVYGGSGPVVEHAVKMRRLPEENLMPRKMARGEVGIETIDRLAAHLAAFHAGAETGPLVDPHGRLEVIKHAVDEDFWQTASFVDQALSRERFDQIQRYSDDFLSSQAPLFQRRIERGFIRDGHGDLHLGNICLNDQIFIFDCIEFNEALRRGDVAADLAFLAMDLDHAGRADLSRRLVEEYVRHSGDQDLTLLMDFYKCYRAYVRGKVNCLAFARPDSPAGERGQALRAAQRYFDLAYGYAGGTRRPRIWVFYGLMGSGKTHWARVAGRRLGIPVLSSDLIRKRLAGLTSETRVYVPFGQGPYGPEQTEKVYHALHELAGNLAGAGMDVILDASYAQVGHRRQVADLAAHAGATATFILTTVPENEAMIRLERREALGRSLSDGRREIYPTQAQSFDPTPAPTRNLLLDTSGPEEEVERRLWNLMET